MNSDRNRRVTRIAVYLVALRGGQVLLGKRGNVDHLKGYWSLPAGHAYEREVCEHAIRREILEECGLELPDNLECIGVMHHNSPPYDYVNFIYRAELSSEAVVHNLEPEKCSALEFFAPDALPQVMAPYIKDMIRRSIFAKSPWISEDGWSGDEKDRESDASSSI